MGNDSIYPRLQEHFHGNRINRPAQCTFQRVIAFVIIIRIPRRPPVIFRIAFLRIRIVSIEACPPADGSAINDRFEDRAHLAGCSHLVILEIFIIQSPHPSLDLSTLRFDCNHCRLKEFQIVLDGIERRELHPPFPSVRTIDQHGLFPVQRLADGCFIHAFRLQRFINAAIPDGISKDFRTGCPRLMPVKMLLVCLLQMRKMCGNRFFRKALHPCIQSRHQHQPVLIEIICRAMLGIVFPEDTQSVLTDTFTQVRGKPAVMIVRRIIQMQRQCLQPPAFRLRKEIIFHHLPDHCIAPLPAPLRMKAWIIIGRTFQHADQRSGLGQGKPRCRHRKVFACCTLNAIGILPKPHRIKIKRQNLVFRINILQPPGGEHLLKFGDHQRHILLFPWIKVLRKLLADRTSPAGTSLPQKESLEKHPCHADFINALVLVETHILCCNQRINRMFRKIFIMNIRAVLNIVLPHHLAILRKHHGCLCILNMAQLLIIGQFPPCAHVHQTDKSCAR